jgi:hypothetical protein
MKKKNAILGLALCVGLLFSAGTFSKNTSAKAGYGLAQLCSYGSFGETMCVAGGGLAGGIVGTAAGTWAGAKFGGTLGVAIGGPVGGALGLLIGAA